MPLKKLSRKAKAGLGALRSDGVIGLMILGTRFTEKNLLKLSRHKEREIQKHGINVKARYSDVLRADYTAKHPKWGGTNKQQLSFNWLMPPPGKGSGGHMNIFRFMKYLEAAGHMNRIYIYTQHPPGLVEDVKSQMGDSYPELSAKMYWVEDGDEMENADGVFATSWETAYASFNSTATGKRFYFVQDFEPYFYPQGSLATLAENTYRFGFYGTTAGNWLATKLKRDYGMDTDFFDFGSDNNMYTFTNKGKRKEIFFYARPYTERRGFEMGIMALDLFHKKYPDYIINLAGWDVSEYDIPFPYNNLQTLEITELSELYNRCAAGLVMSFTNMSLLPLELLGCGTIPVVNDGENNRLVSDNPYIAYTEPTPSSLANKLFEVVERNDSALYAEKAANSVSTASWDDSGKKFVKIVEKETKRNG